MIQCELCAGYGRRRPATVRITYGLYSAYRAGRPHHVVKLCHECHGELWEGGVAPLKPLVTAGLSHYVLEPIV